MIVPESPMELEKFVLSGLRDDEIDSICEFFYVEYDRRELRLIFRDPKFRTGGPVLLHASLMFCRLTLQLERAGSGTVLPEGMMVFR